MRFPLRHLRLMSMLLLLSSPFVSAVSHIAKEGAKYLCRAQKEAGFFKYEFDFLNNTYRRDNNITRQAGAAYGLGEYLLLSHDESVIPCLKKALLAFESTSYSYMEGKSLISFNGQKNASTTGATALGLLGALFYTQATHSKEFDKTIKSWLSGLLAMHIPGKGFQSEPSLMVESPYFNGEAWLALAAYDAFLPNNPIVAMVLLEIDAYFMGFYGKSPTKEFYHWGMMAAAKRYETTRDERFLAFIESQTAWVLSVDKDVRPSLNNCYLMEGFLGVIGSIKNPELKKTLAERIQKEMEKAKTFQIQKGQKTFPLSENHGLYFNKLDAFEGGFLNGSGRAQIRIDFTQHCVSAFVKEEAHKKHLASAA